MVSLELGNRQAHEAPGLAPVQRLGLACRGSFEDRVGTIKEDPHKALYDAL